MTSFLVDLPILFGIDLLRAGGTNAVREIRFGMVADVGLDVVPVTRVVADLLAHATDR